MRIFAPIWPAVQYVWRGSLRVLAVRRWDRVAMDILDMSVTTDKGNRYACDDWDDLLPPR